MKKRSVTLKGHRTSISLEPEFWDILENEAKLQKTSLQKLVESIDLKRGNSNLSSALRLFVLSCLKNAT